jgi:alpha-ribazole phosphatase
MKILLLRHGETRGNSEKRYIGRTDEPLSEEGRGQARALRLPLVDRVYASPYRRCLETAALAFPGREPIVAYGLRECDFGVFEGRSAAEMESWPEYRSWVAGGCLGQIPGGESVPAFQARCCDSFEAIVRGEAGRAETLAFVVHGGVIMSVMARFDEKKRPFYEYQVNNCSCISCECGIGDEITLRALGDEAC